MKISTRRLHKTEGFTLIEVIVSMAIMVTLILSIYNLIMQSLKITQENKMRLGAIILANQKLERIRNLPYDSVGTLTGIPYGVLAATGTENTYDINTLIQYVDDPFDGTFGGTPNDILPADYKVARVRVSWTGNFGYRSVVVWSTIAPRGIETDPGGGVLVVTVANAAGQPVNLADVHVQNNLLVPAISLDLQTATSGSVVLPGAPQSIEGYKIIVSKAGYSTSSTTARTASNTNPTLVNATVLEGEKTEAFFFIDLLATLRIHAFEQNLPENWQINTDTTGENQTNSRIALDSSGNTYVVWQDFRNGSQAKIYAQKYNTSKVAQWAGDKVIGAANNQILPDILVDSINSALYIAWNDDSNGNQDAYLVKLNTSDGSDIWVGSKRVDTGANPADQFRPRISLAGGADLAITWQDNRSSNQDIFVMRYNPDESIAWNDIKVDGGAGASNQTYPVIVTDSTDKTYIAWNDDRNGNQDIYMQSLAAAGTKRWGSDLQVTSAAATQNSVNIAADSGDNIYLVWADERNGNQDVYAQKLDATGTKLWATDLKVNSDTGTTSQYAPSIAINSSNQIFIVWTDERNGNPDIYAQKLDTAGTKLWTDDLRVNINVEPSAQYNPDVTINPANGRPVATWQDDRNANFDIFATEFDAYGTPVDIGNLSLHVVGAKRIGESPVIYKFVGNYTTDGSGMAILNNIEWDSYTVTINPPSTKTIIMADPPIPAGLLPGTTLDLDLYLH